MQNPSQHLLFKGIVILFVLMICHPAGAEDIYFSVTSAQSGQLEGDVTKAGLEGKFQAIKYEYELVIPQAAASSHASLGGKRVHGPIKLTRRVGKGSPLFFNALLVNEVLTVTIDFFLPNRSGKMMNSHKVTLNNSRVVGIKQFTEPIGDRGAKLVFEELTFAFGGIQMQHILSGQSAQDNVQQGARR